MSSSAAEGHGGRLLRRALDALERESPWHARALAGSLAGLDLRVELDGERLALRSDGARASVEPATGPGGAGAVQASVAFATALVVVLLTWRGYFAAGLVPPVAKVYVATIGAGVAPGVAG